MSEMVVEVLQLAIRLSGTAMLSFLKFLELMISQFFGYADASMTQRRCDAPNLIYSSC